MISERQYRRSTFHCEDCPLEGPQHSRKNFATQAAAFAHAQASRHYITEIRTEVIKHKFSGKPHSDNKTKERK